MRPLLELDHGGPSPARRSGAPSSEIWNPAFTDVVLGEEIVGSSAASSSVDSEDDVDVDVNVDGVACEVESQNPACM